MRIVVWVPIVPYRNAILAAISNTRGADLVVLDDPRELPAALEGAEGLISAGASKYTAEIAEIIRTRGTSLRWFQTTAAGNDGLATHGIPDGITVTGSGGHNAPVVAEHAVALLLGIAHALPEFVANKSTQVWGGESKQRLRSLYGKTATIVGFGHIGAQIARRLKAFDIRVLSVTRSGSRHELADGAFSRRDACTAIAQSDAVVVAAPLTPETRHIIGAEEIAAMKPTAYLVNVGRGGLVDQAALESALRAGRIAGAALDVTEPEPLPAGHSLWSAPHLIISPHGGGAGNSESPKRLAATVLRNLESFIAGRPLAHVLEIDTRTASVKSAT